MMNVTHYRVNLHLEHPLRIAFVSDLHDRCPDELIQLIQRSRADLLLIGGDTMERYEKGKSPWTLREMNAWQGIPKSKTLLHDFIKLLDGSLPGSGHTNRKKKWSEDNGRHFLEAVSEMMPVFMSVGNHEWYFLPEDYALFQNCNIQLVDNMQVSIKIGGQTLIIGGLSTRHNNAWLKRFAAMDGKKILLCHHPEYVLRYVGKKYYPCFDLILSGHAHGGQWRIPPFGNRKHDTSVYAPGQGLFPKYAYGKYGHWIIGGGVSNTSSIPRFGNPCELVLIDVI